MIPKEVTKMEKKEADNPSSNPGSGLGTGANENGSSLQQVSEGHRGDTDHRQSLTLQDLEASPRKKRDHLSARQNGPSAAQQEDPPTYNAKNGPAEKKKHPKSLAADPPTGTSNRSLHPIVEAARSSYSEDNNEEGENWDELTSLGMQLNDTTKKNPPSYLLQEGQSVATIPIHNLSPPQDMPSSNDLIRLVMQLQNEIALLKADKVQQPLQKRISFETPTPVPPLTESSQHVAEIFLSQQQQNNNNNDSHSTSAWDESLAHGSDWNWSRHDTFQNSNNSQSQHCLIRNSSLATTSSSIYNSSNNLVQVPEDNYIVPLPNRLARNVSDRSTSSSRQSEKRWKLLNEAYYKHEAAEIEDDDNNTNCAVAVVSGISRIQGFSKRSSLVLVHPEEVRGGRREYTNEELAKVNLRPFPSRFFITNIQVEWNTVFLRTRHTDHHAHKSSFIQIRDAFKADWITNNPTGAKYALTELLNMCYGMAESDYYSFACTVASAFSREASNTEFEKSLLLYAPDQDRINHLMKTELDIQSAPHNRHLTEKQIKREALRQEQEIARDRVRKLLHIVFSKLKQKKILVDDNKHNIYRLVMCMTKYNYHCNLPLQYLLYSPYVFISGKKPYLYAIFSFYFQLCAGLYVAFTLTTLDDPKETADNSSDKWYKNGDLVLRNFALALGTLCYGLMVAYPEVISTNEVFKCLYRSERSPLAFMDFFVNVVLSMAVALCGFFVVLSGETFLDGVLNSVALIFIAEIDDHLPRLLELDIKDIVQGFLIDQAIEEYDDLSDPQVFSKSVRSIEFSDMFLTNTQESGSIPTKGVTFQPYEIFGDQDEPRQQGINGTVVDPTDVGGEIHGSTISLGVMFRSRKQTGVRRKGRGHIGDRGQQVANKRSVTADCLLRKVEWQYTKGYDRTCQPRIGHLRLTKLNDPKNVIEIKGKNREDDVRLRPFFSVTGVFIITCFSMSDDILRLRICGSQQTEDFLCAFDYYNLWPLEPNARQLLRTARIGHESYEWRANERILYGKDPPSTSSPVPNDAPKLHFCNDDEEINLSEPARVAVEENNLGTPMTMNASSEEEEIVFDDVSTDLSNAGGALEYSTACEV